MLNYDFARDTVQFPANLLDTQYRSFTGEILPILKERGTGAIGMKSLAGGELLKTDISAQDAIRYALFLPIDSLVRGMDSLELLAKNLETARGWMPLSGEETEQLLAQAAPLVADGPLERYETA